MTDRDNTTGKGTAKSGMSDGLVLQARGLHRSFHYGSGERLEIIKGVNLDVLAGRSIAITGKSGSGKSTLLHLLGSLDACDSGSIVYQGQNILKYSGRELAQWRNEVLGFVFQFHHLLSDFTALENVMMSALIQNKPSRHIEQRAKDLLVANGLEHRIHHRVWQMSGGEMQRAAVARALMNSPKILLADEPTGNLDSENAETVFELLLRHCREDNMALLVVTHNTELAAQLDSHFELAGGVLHRRKPALTAANTSNYNP